MSSNARESILKSSDRKQPLDREVIELLKNDAQLLAIADAIAATQRRARGGVEAPRERKSRSQPRDER